MIKKGIHGLVRFDSVGISEIRVRKDLNPRAYENRFHEMLHAIELRGGIKLDHDLIRKVARIYAADPAFYESILTFRDNSNE